MDISWAALAVAACLGAIAGEMLHRILRTVDMTEASQRPREELLPLPEQCLPETEELPEPPERSETREVWTLPLGAGRRPEAREVLLAELPAPRDKEAEDRPTPVMEEPPEPPRRA